MTHPGALTLTTPGEREIVMTRAFDAPRRLVFEAFTTPALLQRWLLGPDGWSLVVCEIDLKVGGQYRYVWRHDRDGTSMGMGGVYKEIAAPERIVSTELFDEAWYAGEAVGAVVFVERGGRTTMTQTMTYASREARDAVIKSGMERGVAASFDRLARLLASPAPSRSNVWRSVGAVAAGFVAIVVLSLGTDQVLHVLRVYPPWGQSMSHALFAVATSYRIVYTIAGGYLTARLAPQAPVRHAVILGLVGLVPGALGVVVALTKPEVGPLWYPIALVVTGLPCTWLGGVLFTRTR